MKIHFYDKKIEDFLRSLEAHTIAKVHRTVDLLRTYGEQLRMPHSKKISANVFSLRIKGLIEIRILYCFLNDEIILLHAFQKKSNKIPKKDLQIAKSKYSGLVNT